MISTALTGLSGLSGMLSAGITYLLKALFSGSASTDVVSGYTPDIGGAFAYVAISGSGALGQLDGSGHITAVANGGATSLAIAQNAGVADIPTQAQVDWAWNSTAGGIAVGVLLRWIDSTHYLIAYTTASTVVIKEANGTLSTLATASTGSLSTGTFYTLTVTAKGTTVTATVNGVQISGTCVNTTGTKFGLYANTNSATWGFDNLRARNWWLY